MRRYIYGFLTLLLTFPVYAEQVIAQGSWKTADYEVKGIWHIVEEQGRLSVRLGEDFETKNGPDLHVLLSPKPFSELTNENASDQALIAGLLKTQDRSVIFKKMKGAQSIPLPEGTDLSRYRSILIHCVQFSHLWAGADLPR